MDEQPKYPAEDEDKLIIEPIEPDKTDDTTQEKTQEKKPIEISVPKKTEIPPRPQGEPKEFVKYMCLKCRYKFTRKSDSDITLRCPYCGGGDVEEDTFNINKAISEVE